MPTEDSVSGHPATFVGFDSAWTDNRRAPGAICAIRFDGEHFEAFQPPRLVSFEDADVFIRQHLSTLHPTILTLDQPTIVQNLTGMRSVERVAATLVSWTGGGVQPANRGRVGMFDDDAPVWRFLARLAAAEDPHEARTSVSGLHLIEVFPALALPSLDDAFYGRGMGPRYNPTRRTFRLQDWMRVIDVAGQEAARLGCAEIAAWSSELQRLSPVTKADQDRLDAIICILIGMRWRLDQPDSSMMIGDLCNGYMVTPVSAASRLRLASAALDRGVPIDGVRA